MYRIRSTLRLAEGGRYPHIITGAMLLAVCSRESLMQNIIGGIPKDSDTGAFQLNRKVWQEELEKMPGCPSGSWTPRIGHYASEKGYCPTFTAGCTHARDLLTANYLIAKHAGIHKPDTLLHIAVAGYNRGGTGALNDYNKWGDPDHSTAHANYGKDVIGTRLPQIEEWLREHHLLD